MDIKDRQFLYVNNLSQREQLRDAWHAITLTNSWDFIGRSGDLSPSDESIKDIYSILDICGSTNHSAASFANMISSMRYLALYGEKAFQQKFLGATTM